MTSPPRKSTRRELAELAAEAALNVVPVAGGPLAVGFAYAIGKPFQKRTDEFLAQLAQDVDDLKAQADGLTLDQLVEDERFVDAVVTATRSAQRTHQRDKLNALRYAVLNSALPGAPDTDTQAIFFRWVDDFTVGHLQLLRLLYSPVTWYAQRSLPMRDEDVPGSRRNMVEVGIPEFAGQKEFVDALVRDLSNAGLLVASLDGFVSGRAVYNELTTGLGGKFVAFITDPRQ